MFGSFETSKLSFTDWVRTPLVGWTVLCVLFDIRTQTKIEYGYMYIAVIVRYSEK